MPTVQTPFCQSAAYRPSPARHARKWGQIATGTFSLTRALIELASVVRVTETARTQGSQNAQVAFVPHAQLTLTAATSS